MKISRAITYWLTGVSALLLLIFLRWHWTLGTTRYFDVDEFAHLHWAYQMFSGQKPYIDFLLFFPPGYQWFLVPLYLLGGGVTPILAGRIEAFAVFTALVATTIALFFFMRKTLWIALLSGALLAFLPLPFDKFLEIRPDTLSTLLVMLGILFQVRWMTEGKRQDGFISGASYAVSLIVLSKTLPAVAVAIVIALFAFWEFPLKRNSLLLVLRNTRPFLTGFITPLLMFGLWALTLGNLSLVLYSLVRLPIESNKISQIFIMMPDLFFYPNSIFYGQGGWSAGLLTNHTIWIIGLLIGIVRLVTPYLAAKTDNEQSLIQKRRMMWAELLIAGIFIIQVVAYIMIVPLKHSQYLIPIAVFIAWYTADGVYIIWQKFQKEWGAQLFMGVLVTFIALYVYQINILVEGPKLSWTNIDTLASMKTLFSAISIKEPVLDLDGRMLYYPNPYYTCCLPFGQFAPYLSHPLPSLSQTLETKHTKYIYQGQLERVKTLLPEDAAYISQHYKQYTVGDAQLLVRND